jgi:hypothetical protein
MNAEFRSVNAIGLALVIAPATAWATWREARPRGATPGKRLLRLRVLDEGTEALLSLEKLGSQRNKDCCAVGIGAHGGTRVRVRKKRHCADLVVDTDRNYLWLAAAQPDLVDHAVSQATT